MERGSHCKDFNTGVSTKRTLTEVFQTLQGADCYWAHHFHESFDGLHWPTFKVTVNSQNCDYQNESCVFSWKYLVRVVFNKVWVVVLALTISCTKYLWWHCYCVVHYFFKGDNSGVHRLSMAKIWFWWLWPISSSQERENMKRFLFQNWMQLHLKKKCMYGFH